MGQIFRDSQPSPTLTLLCVQLFGHSALVYSSLQRSFSKVSNFSAAGACADKLADKKAFLLDIPAAQSMLGNFLLGVQLSQLYTPNLLMKNSVVTPCSKKKVSPVSLLGFIQQLSASTCAL